MSARNWTRKQPTSLCQALEWCKDYARDRKNLSVERIAELIGLTNHWTIYKWIESGRIPASMIRPYEAVCGINFVTRWLAASNGCLLVPIPTGKTASAEDMQLLQQSLNDAIGCLLAFYSGNAEAAATLGALRGGMENIAWHHANVARHAQPELEL